MIQDPDIGWKQRLQNFSRACGLLSEALAEGTAGLSPLEREGAARVLPDGQVWIDMLDHRNLVSHTCDLKVFTEAVEAIATRYLPTLRQLHDFLTARNGE